MTAAERWATDADRAGANARPTPDARGASSVVDAAGPSSRARRSASTPLPAAARHGGRLASVLQLMPRADVVGVLAAFLGWFVVACGVLVWSENDRRALASSFIAAAQRQATELAKEAQDAFDGVVDDLHFAVALVDEADAPDRSRELSALLAVVRPYRVVEVFDRAGRRLTRVVEPPPSKFDAEPFAEVLATTARQALAQPRTVVTSARLPADAGGSLRVFALSFARGNGALALIVDTQLLFASAKIVQSDPTTRLLVLGSHGAPLPFSDPAAAGAITDPQLSALVTRLRSGQPGSETVVADVARSTGLGAGEVAVTWAPIEIQGQPRWVVAALRSMAALRERQQELALQMVVAVSALVLLLGFLAVRAIRRAREEASLRARLQNAEREAALQDELMRAEKLATVGVLAAGVAHEIGTPLGIVRGRAEHVAGKLGPGHPQEQSLRNIVGQIDRVTTIVQELLDFARPPTAEAAHGRHAEAAAAAGAAVTTAMSLLQLSDRRRRQALRVEIDDDVPPVAAQSDHLQQVVVNLCMNALDACADVDAPAVVVRVGRDPDSTGRVRIVVEDNGCGIPDELRHRVFDPFFTTKKRGRGTGLGLAVVSRIVNSYGATIALDSEVGRFTRVCTSWPAAGGST
jgi:signal transduction histidine kinase